jgi:NAD(P)-dependent dehydrogenase (short-subunit alcohol dehydrogenase family)
MKDKIIIITGAGKGLGKTMADMLTAKGATVISSGRQIESPGIKADVTREEDLSNLMNEVINKYGKIDIWINNAGVWLPKKPIENFSANEVQDLFQTNFFGTFFGMRVAIRQMKEQKYGTIVNICSTTAFDGMNGSSGSAYVSSKYAIRGLTNCIRDELKDTNISVIGVYPGGFKSDLFNKTKPENFDEFMSVESVAEKIVKNLEQETPDFQLIIKRPGQIITNEPKID